VNNIGCFQIAGVPCEGTPNFWLTANGSISEEGQKNDRGRIWDKVIFVMMLVLFLFGFYCDNESSLVIDRTVVFKYTWHSLSIKFDK
jgi:hypothetical protein